MGSHRTGRVVRHAVPSDDQRPFGGDACRQGQCSKSGLHVGDAASRVARGAGRVQ